MPWIEQARLLLRKARQDVVIVSRAVDDPEIADEIVGFHVQQVPLCEDSAKRNLREVHEGGLVCARGDISAHS